MDFVTRREVILLVVGVARGGDPGLVDIRSDSVDIRTNESVKLIGDCTNYCACLFVYLCKYTFKTSRAWHNECTSITHKRIFKRCA